MGHLRTTVVGDSLVKVLEALGDTVIRQNHIGDWGTPFGMLIEHWLEIGEDSPEAALLVEDPSAFYQAARAKFDASAADADGFATRARLRVVALQGGDEETFAVWQRLVAQSKRYFNAIYSMLGISLTDDHIAGESSYDAHLAQLCQELEERGLARISDGALCTFPAGFTGRDGQPLPLIIRKSDGGYGYGTTDLATIRYRVRDWRPTGSSTSWAPRRTSTCGWSWPPPATPAGCRTRSRPCTCRSATCSARTGRSSSPVPAPR